MVAALLLATPCGSAAAEPLVKDLRRKGDESTLRVVFCARPGAPGHAFVVIGREDEIKRASTMDAFGFYPAGGKGVLGPVPGKVVDEVLDGKGTAASACRVVLKVDRKQVDAVEQIRRKWAAKKEYKVLTADCVTFSDEVARSLGLKVPPRGDAKLPMTYIDELSDLNR